MSALAATSLAFLLTAGAQLAGEALPAQPPSSSAFRSALAALREHLSAPAPPVSEREEAEALRWMRAAAPHARQTLVGHHVIVLATDEFANKAAQHDFVRHLDLGYRVLAHVLGLDPSARVGRRFVVWPDPGLARGLRNAGGELRIHISAADWEDIEWLERCWREMGFGFLAHHPARHLQFAGLSTGWAEFMQALVPEHLASLGAPYAGSGELHARRFLAAAEREYLATPLPIEALPHYEPAAGLLFELASNGRLDECDWSSITKLLRGAPSAPASLADHLLPARFAFDCMAAFGAERARPILARYRFPLDRASLDAARGLGPANGPMTVVTGSDGWRCVGPVTSVGAPTLELEPFGAEDLAWRWSARAVDAPAPPLEGREYAPWRAASLDSQGAIELSDSEGQPAYFLLATTLPEALRTPLTLALATDGECALWLDGELVHQSSGAREFDSNAPEIAYADARGSLGQIVALVASRGGRTRFSLRTASGGLLFSGFDERYANEDAQERADAVRHLASRRFRQPVRARLEQAARDRDARVRAAAQWWFSALPDDGGHYREAEDALSLGSVHGGGAGHEAGASGGQTIGRGWGREQANWLSLPLRIERAGAQRVRIRHSSPSDASLRVRIRVGGRVRFTSGALKLTAGGTDAGSWRWTDVTTGALEPGVAQVELFEPHGGPVIDAVGLVAR